MLGKTTLFVPGFDHAGISTQSVVEKRLFKTSNKTRHDLGREKFLETVLDWKNESVFVFCRQHVPNFFPDSYQERITNQLHRLGGSYDWSRVAFTMNPVGSRVDTSFNCTNFPLVATVGSCRRDFLPSARRRDYIPR
jgi:valyl-tRNA synthetase